jgi:hypothetical protein
LDPQGQWALAKPADDYKSPGWALLEDLNVDGSLAKAPRIITAWVDSNELTLRRGPGLFHEPSGQVAINTLVAVIGVNEGRNWALIQPVMSGGQGWIPINFLTLAGSWTDVPLAPAPPMEPAEASSGQGMPAPPSASAAGPGKVVLQTSSGGDIMALNPDGTGLRRLTHGIDPALSPDGSTVAFTRWTGEDGTLWLIDVDGNNERAILGETKQAKHPAWSPDGQQIVVNFQHEGRLDPKQNCENLIELGDARPDIPWNVDPDSVEVKLIEFIPYLCWTLPPGRSAGCGRATNRPCSTTAAKTASWSCAAPEWPWAWIRPIRILSVVVFPAPFGPTKPKISPRWTRKEIPCRTRFRTSPKPGRKSLTMSFGDPAIAMTPPIDLLLHFPDAGLRAARAPHR